MQITVRVHMLSKFPSSWLSDVFSCMLLTVIKWFLLQFGVISTCKFSKTTNCTCPTSLCNFVVFEKLTYAYWHQIALEMMLLPILTNVTLEKGN